MTERDDEVGKVLDSIDVPKRGENFFADLETRMEGEREVPTAKRKPRIRFAALGTVAAVAAFFVIISTVDFTGKTGGGNDVAQSPDVTAFKPTLASQIIEKASSTLANVKSIGGQVTFVQYPYRFAGDENDNPGYTVDGTFKLRSTGDYRFDAQKGDNDWNGPTMSAYSVDKATFTRCDQEPDKQWGCTSFTGLVATDSAAQPQLWDLNSLVSVLRASASSRDPSLEETTFNNRPAWKVSATFGDRPNGGAEAAVIYVDQQTAFPVSAETTRDGRAYTSITIKDLQQVETTDADFVITAPAGAFVNNPSEGPFVRTTLGDVESTVGYKPALPTYIPDGFERAEISVAKVGGDSGYGGEGVVNSDNRDIFVVTYRRGLESFTITTRDSLGKATWLDPLGEYGEQVLASGTSTLNDGSFKGMAITTTETNRDVRLWGFNNEYVLTVSGDLPTSELQRVADSLEVQ